MSKFWLTLNILSMLWKKVKEQIEDKNPNGTLFYVKRNSIVQLKIRRMRTKLEKKFFRIKSFKI